MSNSATPFPDVADRAAEVRQRIADAGGQNVRLVAVTKAFGVDAVRAAVEAGLLDIGENYAQELVDKAGEIGAGSDESLRWHFIGGLQTNKVRDLAPHVALWQTVDRDRLVREVAKRAPGAAILVQVNLAGSEGRAGCAWDDVPALVEGASEAGLEVRGLMGVAPMADEEEVRGAFRRLVAVADQLGLPERSIGMSGDLEVAVQEGSTMVRVGRDLFGPRPERAR